MTSRAGRPVRDAGREAELIGERATQGVVGAGGEGVAADVDEDEDEVIGVDVMRGSGDLVGESYCAVCGIEEK